MKTATLAFLLVTSAAALAQQATVTEFGTSVGAWPYTLKANQNARPVIGQTLECAFDRGWSYSYLGYVVTGYSGPSYCWPPNQGPIMGCMYYYAYSWSLSGAPISSASTGWPLGGSSFAYVLLGSSSSVHQSGLALPANLGILDPAWANAHLYISTEIGAVQAGLVMYMSSGPSGAGAGTHRYQVAIPNDPGLAGTKILGQGLVGTSFGNGANGGMSNLANFTWTNAIEWVIGTY